MLLVKFFFSLRQSRIDLSYFPWLVERVHGSCLFLKCTGALLLRNWVESGKIWQGCGTYTARHSNDLFHSSGRVWKPTNLSIHNKNLLHETWNSFIAQRYYSCQVCFPWKSLISFKKCLLYVSDLQDIDLFLEPQKIYSGSINCWMYYRITESFRLEKTVKVIKSSLWLIMT